jgi:hypothetical protein
MKDRAKKQELISCPTNPPFWNVFKSRGLILPQTSFKTYVVVERFCLCRHSRH